VTMALQLGRAEVLARQHAADHGMEVTVHRSRWLGPAQMRDGKRYRVAELIIQDTPHSGLTVRLELCSDGSAIVV
jgi:hypothetical protein